MIKRTLTIKVQGNRCVCDAPLYLHTQDKNIHVVINVTNTKFEIKNNMLLSFTLIKPNGDEVDKSDCYIDKGQCHLLFSGEDFDEETEVGTHLVQLKLYDEHRQSRINIPPFAMHVLKNYGSFYADEEMEGILAEQNAYKLMTENKLALEMSQSVLISDLPTTIKVEGYAPVTQGDTTYKLDMSNVASKNYVETEIAKAQLSGGGSGEIDLSAYATKDEVNSSLSTKSDVGHTHSQYLTQHQDISHLASKQELTEGLDTKANVSHTHSYNDLTDKPTIPSIDGLATTEYVDEAVANVTIDTSNLATKQELSDGLNGKANLVHTHDQYLTEHQDLSSYALKADIPSLDGYATKEELNGKADTNHKHVVADITDLVIPTKVSELTNDSGFITTIPNEYVTETELDAKGYLTEHQDISGLATKQELSDGLATKSDTTHNHDTVYAPIVHEHSQYLTEHQDISNLATKEELTNGLATKSDTSHNHDDVYSKLDHTHNGMLTSTTITRIELVDALPEVQEENVLYIVRGE